MAEERDADADDAAAVDDLRCLLAAEKIRNRLLTLREADLASQVEIIAREVEDLYRYFGVVPHPTRRNERAKGSVERPGG